MGELRSRHVFTIQEKLCPVLEVGDTPLGNRRIFTLSGGQFQGERLRGEVMAEGSSDLLLVRADGVFRLDARHVLITDDRAVIVMTYRGLRHASPEATARIARGEPVEGPDYYLRTTPYFETSSPKYTWLNKIVCVGVGERRASEVVYEVFEIL